MFKKLRAIIVAVLFAAPSILLAGENPMPSKTAYDFEFVTNDGKSMPLSGYKGKVLLIVNTASKCGFTNQYEGLESLYEAYKEQGLVVIGVPSNDFGGQEPGTDKEIAEFCKTNFHITFPLTQKTVVSGDAAHPFYQWAAEKGVGGFMATRPRWNFHKYIISRSGELLDSFGSMTKPESEDVRAAVIKALAK